MLNREDLLPEEQAHPELCRELATLYQLRPAEKRMLVRLHGQLVTRQTPDAETHQQIEHLRRLPVRRRTAWLIPAAALILALVGTVLAGPLGSWFSGKTSTAFAYAPINKSLQISNGVTLTAIKGYADPKHLVLYYGVHIPSDLRGTYPLGFALKATLQGQEGTVSATECGVKSATEESTCAIHLQTNQDIVGDTLQVTWHVTQVELIPDIANKADIFLKGDWTLQFTLPFHHQVQDPPQFFPGPPPVNS